MSVWLKCLAEVGLIHIHMVTQRQKLMNKVKKNKIKKKERKEKKKAN